MKNMGSMKNKIKNMDDVVRPIWAEGSEALGREFVFPEMKKEK